MLHSWCANSPAGRCLLTVLQVEDIQEERQMDNESQMVYASLLVCKFTGQLMFTNCPLGGRCAELAKNLRQLL
jgi:hypothetical protein